MHEQVAADQGYSPINARQLDTKTCFHVKVQARKHHLACVQRNVILAMRY